MYASCSPSSLSRALSALIASTALLVACGGSTGSAGNTGALCAQNNGGCDKNAACSVANGAVACSCNAGYQGNGKSCADVDECANHTATCDAHALCTNTPGSYTCMCIEGFTGDGHSCKQADVCATNNGGCDPNATCALTSTSRVCTCKTGFVGDGLTCTDIDECTEGAGPCDKNATCTNTPGSYTCKCNQGYTGPGNVCMDVDECADHTATCDANATCMNTPGSYLCKCHPGYVLDGMSCVDEDECTDGTADCSPHATCTNTVGSYTCACNPGYMDVSGGTGTACAIATMCSPQCDQNATCSTVTGFPLCVCNQGYTGDGHTCMPQNLCTQQGVCGDNAACNPTGPGTFTCTCNPGYMGDGHICMAVDACDQQGICDQNATCNYTGPGTYTCTCNQGYYGDGKSCTVLDCSVNNGGCPSTARCSEVPGTPRCTCLTGLVGDGATSCTPARFQFSAGNAHACAVTSDGSLWCWGENPDGRLGNGMTTSSATPQQVMFPGAAGSMGGSADGGMDDGGTSTDDGGMTSTGSSDAGMDDGGMADAGMADAGMADGGMADAGMADAGMGDGGTTTPPAPQSTWVSVSAGQTHTCAIDSTGALWCWGDNTQNGLGPVPDFFLSNVLTPEQVGTDTNWAQVSAGGNDTCAIKTDGSLWCWGDNLYCTLGTSSAAQFGSPNPTGVPASGVNTWAYIATGPQHTCGIQSDGTLWCWGMNDHGQLGQGSATGGYQCLSKTQQVGFDHDWVSVSTGNSHTCGIHTNGKVQCWGKNDSGEVGHSSSGSDVVGLAPVYLPNQSGVDVWSDVVAGGDHSCGVAPDGTLFCWGANSAGELGAGTTNSLIPEQVGAAQSWAAVSAGGQHTCAAGMDDSLSCWGADGTGATQSTPTQVMGIK